MVTLVTAAPCGDDTGELQMEAFSVMFLFLVCLYKSSCAMPPVSPENTEEDEMKIDDDMNRVQNTTHCSKRAVISLNLHTSSEESGYLPLLTDECPEVQKFMPCSQLHNPELEPESNYSTYPLCLQLNKCI